MTRLKVPSDAVLQVALLKRIAEYKGKRITVAALLSSFIKAQERSASHEGQPAVPLLTFGGVRGHEWEQRSIDALREMYENEGWIHLEYLDDERVNDTREIGPVVTQEDQRRLVVTMTKRGQLFLERGRNPESKHLRAPSTKSRKGSQRPRNQSIADLVKSKEQRDRKRKPKNEAEARERIAASIAGRRGQQEFRQQLLCRYNRRCLITGYNAEAVLEAAHIQPYSDERTFKVSNGLLLRADIHTLFDLGLIAIDTAEMTVITAEALKHTVYAEFNGKKLQLPDGSESIPDRKALDDHYQSAMRRQQQAFGL